MELFLNELSIDKTVVSLVVDIFNEANTYDVDQVVFYSGKLFKFTEAKAPGSWDSEKVTAVELINSGGGPAPVPTGSAMSKVRYPINVNNWSATVNANNYYTYSVTLNPTLKLTYSPNVMIAGATDNDFPTSTAKTQFALLEQVELAANDTIVLYATTKPDSTFYVYIEGEAE